MTCVIYNYGLHALHGQQHRQFQGVAPASESPLLSGPFKGFLSPAVNDGHAPAKQHATLQLESFKGIQSKRTIKANVITLQMRNAG